MMMMQVSKASKSSRGTSYKDMGQKRSHNGGGSSSYKNMSSSASQGECRVFHKICYNLVMT